MSKVIVIDLSAPPLNLPKHTEMCEEMYKILRSDVWVCTAAPRPTQLHMDNYRLWLYRDGFIIFNKSDKNDACSFEPGVGLFREHGATPEKIMDTVTVIFKRVVDKAYQTYYNPYV